MASFLCQNCGQQPFPKTQLYGGVVKTLMRTYHDNYGVHMYLKPLHVAALDLAKYIKLLEDQLRAAQDTLKGICVLTAPIRRLPDEILIEIFDILLSDSFERTHTRRFPLADLSQITLVCKRWRNIILSTKSFWTTIHLPASTSNGPKRSYYQFLDLQLRLSAALPLVLTSGHISNFRASARPSGPSRHPLFTQLRRHYSRIKRVELNISPKAISIFETALPMPALKHLHLQISSTASSDGPVDLNLPSVNFPSLTHVDLFFQCEVSRLSLPWSQIVSFKVVFPSSNPGRGPFGRIPQQLDPFSIVPRLIRAEKLDITFESPNDRPPRDVQDSILPHLSSLTLGWPLEARRCAHAKSFLQHLDAPGLQNMTLCGSGLEAWPCDVLLSIPKLPSLVVLHVDLWVGQGSRSKLTNIIQALHALVNLETFTCSVLYASNFPSQILKELAKPGHGNGGTHNTPLFPRLRSLDLRCISLADSLDSLQKFVLQRMHCVRVPIEHRSPLRTVFLECEVNGIEGQLGDLVTVTTVAPLHYSDDVTSLRIKGNFSQFALEKLVSLSCITGSQWCCGIDPWLQCLSPTSISPNNDDLSKSFLND